MVKEAAAFSSPSLDQSEVEKFSRLAAEWWNPEGKFAVLHKFNPLRLAYIREQVTARFGRDPYAAKPFAGLDVLDIGCGGGLLSEPMARLGASVTGIDPSEQNLKTALAHAAEQALEIEYRTATAEMIAAEGRRFQVILNMEVVEHTADPAQFIHACASMLAPQGLMFVATINRTFKSFALAIIGAEYVLGWLPKGTHQWENLITPDELRAYLEQSGVKLIQTVGVIYNPLAGSWQRSQDTGVNYMMLAQRPS